jgi:hypothetical protein
MCLIVQPDLWCLRTAAEAVGSAPGTERLRSLFTHELDGTGGTTGG